MSSPKQPEPIAPDKAAAGMALVIIDMISCWDFLDAKLLLPGAARIAKPISALKARCQAAGVPVIYANDNRGRWRSDFRALIQMALERGGPGARITEMLRPGPEDYFVLKPSQSGFHGTPLDLLLRHLDVNQLVITGVSSDQCVLATLLDARMRCLDPVIPRDCVATQTSARQRTLLRQLEEVHKVPTPLASRLRLERTRKAP